MNTTTDENLNRSNEQDYLKVSICVVRAMQILVKCNIIKMVISVIQRLIHQKGQVMTKKPVKETIHAKGMDIAIYTEDYQNEYISLIDIARYKSDEPKDVIKNWMRSKDTIEFLGLWEQLHNDKFKGVEFDSFRNQAGSNAFTLSPQKWIDSTNAIGIVSRSGRNGGTFAHSDIAFEFASWISAEFKLYIIKDYKRLKNDESSRLFLGWNLNREISKLNYRIHTDAIKENLIPPELTKYQISITYASEADVLNVALFGLTAKQWREKTRTKVETSGIMLP